MNMPVIAGIAAGVVIVIGVLFIIPLGTAAPDIPWIHVGQDGQPDPGQDPGTINNNMITGNMRADLILHYKGGGSDVFSDTFHFPDIALSVSANNKEIDSIELSTFAKLNVPQNSGHTIGNTVFSESTINVYAGAQRIGTKSCNTFPSTSSVGNEYQLCAVTIPADMIKIASGTYNVTVQSHDDIRVAIDGTDKHMILDSSPQVRVSNNGLALNPIQVVTYTPAGAIQLTNDPVYTYYSCATVQEPGKMCPSVVLYHWFVNVKATGFKANAPISFAYEEHSYFKTAQHMPLYPTVPRIVTSDGQGSATDSTQVYNGYSTPECVYYGSYVTISDGLNDSGKIQIGCIY